MHYRGENSFSAIIATSDEMVNLRGSNDLILGLSIMCVVLAFSGMLIVGALMKRHRDRGYEKRTSIDERKHFL